MIFISAIGFTEENKINWLNLSISKSLKNLNENKKLFTNTNIKEVTSNFKNKDPKDLNNYTSLLELNHITNKLIKKSRLHEEVYMAKIAEKASRDVVKDIFEVVTLFEGGEEYFILPDYYSDKDGDEYYPKSALNHFKAIVKEIYEEQAAARGDYDE